MVAAEARYGRFSLVGDFFYAALRAGPQHARHPLEGGHTRVTITAGTLLGTFRVVDQPRQSLELGAGTRIWGVTTKVSLNPGLSAGVIRKASPTWADPVVAARYHATLWPRFA